MAGLAMHRGTVDVATPNMVELGTIGGPAPGDAEGAASPPADPPPEVGARVTPSIGDVSGE